MWKPASTAVLLFALVCFALSCIQNVEEAQYAMQELTANTSSSPTILSSPRCRHSRCRTATKARDFVIANLRNTGHNHTQVASAVHAVGTDLATALLRLQDIREEWPLCVEG